MGIFAWVKKLFKKTISLSEVNKSHLVALVSSGNIKFGTKLEVGANFVAVLVYKNKIADTFVEGTHKLDIPQMPLLTRFQKLTKPNKKGELPKNFKADIYFVNLGLFENQHFGDFEKVLIKDKDFKKMLVGLEGNFSYYITSPVDFMEAMFTQYGVLRNQIAKDELSFWVSTLVAKKVQKNAPSVYKLYERDSSCFDGLCEYINKNLDDCGVKLEKVEITEVKFPKKIYKKITLSYTDTFELKDIEYNVNTLPKNESQIENNSEIIDDVKNQKLTHVESGIALNEKAEIQNDVEFQNEQKTHNMQLNDILEKNSEVTETFDEPIHKTIEYKQCSVCGAYSAKDSEICFNCKSSFK